MGGLKWWQFALAVVLIGGCCVLATAVALQARERQAAETQTALAALPTAAVAGGPTATLPTVRGTRAATASPSPTETPFPVSAAALQHLEAAASDFASGQTEAALAQLDQAVALDPNDTAVLLRAGDLTLAQKLALDSLQRYYVPAAELEKAAPDARIGAVQSHAALGFYVVAADQAAGDFLKTQIEQYPQPAVPQIAQARYQIFFAASQSVPAQLNGMTKTTGESSLSGLVLGDYYLARSQLAEATREYAPIALLRLNNGTVPDWIIREARCDEETIRVQRASAKLEASCADLSLLLTGK